MRERGHEDERRGTAFEKNNDDSIENWEKANKEKNEERGKKEK